MTTDVLPSQGDAFIDGVDGRPRLPEGASTALNVEPHLNKLPFVGQYVRRWGPSSMHAGGLVGHVFVDTHVDMISENIDPVVYLSMVTRSGGEQLLATE